VGMILGGWLSERMCSTELLPLALSDTFLLFSKRRIVVICHRFTSVSGHSSNVLGVCGLDGQLVNACVEVGELRAAKGMVRYARVYDVHM
jgi:hypothetical protein